MCPLKQLCAPTPGCRGCHFKGPGKTGKQNSNVGENSDTLLCNISRRKQNEFGPARIGMRHQVMKNKWIERKQECETTPVSHTQTHTHTNTHTHKHTHTHGRAGMTHINWNFQWKGMNRADRAAESFCSPILRESVNKKDVYFTIRLTVR